jgi:hypothetical protein
MPKVAAGVANVAGMIIEKENNFRIPESTWTATKISGFHYYIYLKREGDYTVDFIKPIYNQSYQGKYHPTRAWRYIGLFYVSSEGRVIYKLGYAYQQTREIVIAPTDYPLYADYYCDGINDEEQFQDVSDYLNEAYGGGAIIVKQAKGLTNNAYQFGTNVFRIWSNISLVGESAVIEHSTDTAIEMGDYTDNTANTNIAIKGITLKNSSEKTYGILVADTNHVIIEDCRFEGSWGNQCILVWSTGNAAGADQVFVRNNYFKVNTGSGTGTVVGFVTGASGYETCIISGCTFEQCSGGAIALAGSYNFVAYNNVIRDHLKTGTWSLPITISGKGQAYSNTILGHLYALGDDLHHSNAGIYLSFAAAGDEYARIYNNYIEGCEGPGIYIAASYNNAYLWSNLSRRNGNLFANGNCESTIGPSLFSEGHNISNGTFSRVTTSPYFGTYCAQINKDTAAAGGDCIYEFHDTGSDLHSLVAVTTYTIKLKLFIVGDGNGAASGALYTEVTIEIGDTTGSWTYDQATIAATYDAWQEVEVSRQIRSGATDCVIRAVIDSAADQNSQIRLDDCRFYCEKITIAHECNFDDNSGETVYQYINSWQDPEE